MISFKTEELFDLSHTLAKDLILKYDNQYHVLPHIKDFIINLCRNLSFEEYDEVTEGVFIAKDAIISDKAVILPPTIIGHRTEVRPGAYIRGSVLIGDDAVIGNSTEIKNAIIFDGVQLPHYNYVGDSILGYMAHLGAGAVISNFKLDHSNINIRSADEKIETGLRKFGAIIGDYCEIGCNSVIFPGSILAKKTLVYPLTPFRGITTCASIVRTDNTVLVRHDNND